MVIYALLTSRFIYCNALYVEWLLKNIWNILWVQNAIARLLSGIFKKISLVLATRYLFYSTHDLKYWSLIYKQPRF